MLLLLIRGPEKMRKKMKKKKMMLVVVIVSTENSNTNSNNNNSMITDHSRKKNENNYNLQMESNANSTNTTHCATSVNYSTTLSQHHHHQHTKSIKLMTSGIVQSTLGAVKILLCIALLNSQLVSAGTHHKSPSRAAGGGGGGSGSSQSDSSSGGVHDLLFRSSDTLRNEHNNYHRPKFRIIEAPPARPENDMIYTSHNLVPAEQHLALQIMITDQVGKAASGGGGVGGGLTRDGSESSSSPPPITIDDTKFDNHNGTHSLQSGGGAQSPNEIDVSKQKEKEKQKRKKTVMRVNNLRQPYDMFELHNFSNFNAEVSDRRTPEKTLTSTTALETETAGEQVASNSDFAMLKSHESQKLNRHYYYSVGNGARETGGDTKQRQRQQTATITNSHPNQLDNKNSIMNTMSGGSGESLQSHSKTPTPDSRQRRPNIQRSELIRTQHRPPWFWKNNNNNNNPIGGGGGGTGRDLTIAKLDRFSGAGDNLNGSPAPTPTTAAGRFRLKFKTTMAPVMTTTEFFRLISSAHSPIKINLTNKLKSFVNKQHSTSSSNNNNNNKTAGEIQIQQVSSDDGGRRNDWSNWPSLSSGQVDDNGLEASGEYQSNATGPMDVPKGSNGASGSSSGLTTTTTESGPAESLLSTRSSAKRVPPSSSPSPHVTPQYEHNQQRQIHNQNRNQSQNQSQKQQNQSSSVKSEERILSPEIVVKDDGDLLVTGGGGGGTDDSSGSQQDSADNQLGARRQLINYTIQVPSSSHKRPVTIIRHSPGRRRGQGATITTTTTELPRFLVLPNVIRIQTTTPRARRPQTSTTETPTPPSPSPPTQAPALADTQAEATWPPAPQLVRLISKQKHKYDDNIVSPALTVIDNDAFRLPPNTTAVHNNRLLIRIKPGRYPPARFQVTTEYPYYNPVAGITPPYSSSPQTTTRQPSRPASLSGPNYGLVKPASDTQHHQQQSTPTNQFGAQHIRFPAAPPGHAAAQNNSSHGGGGELQLQVPPPPDKINITVPDNADLVGPNRVPDRLVLATNEPAPSNASTLVTSETTIVGRPPYGSSVVNQDGIVRLSTTRRPNRFSTTKRINIISSNTTVITTNPDQLHDVLSNVIAGSHEHNNHLSAGQGNRPGGGSGERPGFLASLAKIFNASVATTAIAMLTLIKTILIALLVMFLPPIALTAAIVQAVSIG